MVFLCHISARWAACAFENQQAGSSKGAEQVQHRRQSSHGPRQSTLILSLCIAHAGSSPLLSIQSRFPPPTLPNPAIYLWSTPKPGHFFLINYKTVTPAPSSSSGSCEATRISSRQSMTASDPDEGDDGAFRIGSDAVKARRFDLSFSSRRRSWPLAGQGRGGIKLDKTQEARRDKTTTWIS